MCGRGGQFLLTGLRTEGSSLAFDAGVIAIALQVEAGTEARPAPVRMTASQSRSADTPSNASWRSATGSALSVLRRSERFKVIWVMRSAGSVIRTDIIHSYLSNTR